MDTARSWLAVTSEIGSRDLARAGWRTIPLGRAIAPRPVRGDRLIVLRTHRPAYVTAAVLVGSADVLGDADAALELRHRFVAPDGHEVPLASVDHLEVSRGWTHERLGALMGLVVPVAAHDFVAIEAELRARALAFGPAPSRSAHHRPRTPGRRRLIAARLAARRPLSR